MNALEQAREKHIESLGLRTDRYQSMVRHAFNAGAYAAMTLLPAPKREKFRGVSKFLRRLASEGGEIVSTAALTVEQINEAREAGRMFVLADGLGFVIRPGSSPSNAGVPQVSRGTDGTRNEGGA